MIKEVPHVEVKRHATRRAHEGGPAPWWGAKLPVTKNGKWTYVREAHITKEEMRLQKTLPVKAVLWSRLNDYMGKMKPVTSKSVDAYWVYGGRVFTTADHDLTPEDVRALANEADNKRRLRLEKAHALQAMADQTKKPRREVIPQNVKVEVWQRDGGACADCGSKEDLEFDHIIPLAMGGANTFRNLQLLCGTCNRRKGATLG